MCKLPVAAACAPRLTPRAFGSLARRVSRQRVGSAAAAAAAVPVLCPSPAAERGAGAPSHPPSPPSSPPSSLRLPSPVQHYHMDAESLRITAAAGGV